MKKHFLCGAAICVLVLLVCRTYGSTAIDVALWEAVNSGNEKWTAQLLEQGANVNVTNNFGKTPLMLAATNGNTRLVELLLKNGADVRASERDGYTALRWALEKGHKEIVGMIQARLGGVTESKGTGTGSPASRPTGPHKKPDVDRARLEPTLESIILIAPLNVPVRGEHKEGLQSTLALTNLTPLYTEPKLPGEGVWQSTDMSGNASYQPLIYTTLYRPSSEFPNAIVYMLLFDMKRVSMKFYLGTAEQEATQCASGIDPSMCPLLVAVTNGLWQTRHAGRAGIICHGRVLKKMANGVASIVLFKDGSVDILEWNDQIPVSEVSDARQLKHLIVRNGKVVTTIRRRGKEVDAEIGLGSLLNEARPTIRVSSEESTRDQWALNITSGPLWFIATRSGFGIRKDGNLVYALGHHISTKDLAKALALAGCVRALHGDANPGNCVGVLYSMEQGGRIAKGVRLSPHLDRGTVKRYLNGTYPKDFFAYFRRTEQNRQVLSRSRNSSMSAPENESGM